MHGYVCFSQKNENCYDNLKLRNWGLGTGIPVLFSSDIEKSDDLKCRSLRISSFTVSLLLFLSLLLLGVKATLNPNISQLPYCF